MKSLHSELVPTAGVHNAGSPSPTWPATGLKMARKRLSIICVYVVIIKITVVINMRLAAEAVENYCNY